MHEFEAVLERYCSRLLEAIEVVSNENGMVDMNDWFNRFSFDVRSHFQFSTFLTSDRWSDLSRAKLWVS